MSVFIASSLLLLTASPPSIAAVRRSSGTTTTTTTTTTLPLSLSPTIASLSRTRGMCDGGLFFSIVGTNLSTATSVTIGGVTASFMVTGDSLQVATPPSTVGKKDVVVVTPSGTATLPLGFEYIGSLTFRTNQVEMEGMWLYGDAPTISSLTRTSGLASGGTPFSIVGGSLWNATSVTVGGVAARFTNGYSDALEVIAPPHAPGLADVTVATRLGSATLPLAFNYLSPLLFKTSQIEMEGMKEQAESTPAVTAAEVFIPAAITAVTPTQGIARGGTPIRLHGTHLLEATSVTIGGRVATSVYIQSDSLFAVSPPGSVGKQNVTVVTPYGTTTLDYGFEYLAPVKFQSNQLSMEGLRLYVPPAAASSAPPVAPPPVPPTISIVTPNRGVPRGGILLTIGGTGLKEATAVTIGGVTAKFQVYGDSLQVGSPPNSIGLKDVTVVTPYGTVTLPYGFEYLAPVKFQSGQLSMEGLRLYGN